MNAIPSEPDQRLWLIATSAAGGAAALATAVPLVSTFAPSERAAKPDVSVAAGICTHLGCSPGTTPASTANPSLPADGPSGFFCPCHGSTFDGAGRVFKNKPVPTNLEVPPYRYASDSRILIGDDAQA